LKSYGACVAAIEWPTWIGVVAENLERQRAFYRDVLGFVEIAHGPGWVQFGFGDTCLLEVLQRDARPQYDRARYQVGYAVDDIEAARARLVAQGVSPISQLEGDAQEGGRWCYFEDAEGNTFELKERAGGEP
jgi:catechol 2,3-dioxygenase-like lactoylglutathione lyase family enzyme